MGGGVGIREVGEVRLVGRFKIIIGFVCGYVGFKVLVKHQIGYMQQIVG